MKLVLFRHGLAVERDDFLKSKKDDSLRPLVPKGEERVDLMGNELKKWLEGTDILVSSPYVRAKQTATILKKHLKPKKNIEAMELIPSAPPMALAQWLRVNAALATCIVAVGHEPQLDLFATWAVCGQLESFIRLKKSGIIGLEIENFQDIGPARAELRFLVTPNMFED